MFVQMVFMLTVLSAAAATAEKFWRALGGVDVSLQWIAILRRSLRTGK
jgi:hypothetical protein